MDKTGRNGLRVGDIMFPDFKKRYDKLVSKHKKLLQDDDLMKNLSKMEEDWFNGIEVIKSFKMIDSEHYLHQAQKAGKKILAEGAQGTLLDIDFGSYPFVTSSNTISAGACTGLGIAPNKIGDVFGIFKAYCTRVGSGPFPTELFDEVGDFIGRVGNEFGATTGRKRRCGWLDLPALKYAIAINGVTKLMMMKADVLSELKYINVCTHYLHNGEKIDYLPFDTNNETLKPVYKQLDSWSENLTELGNINQAPNALMSYIAFLEHELETPITIVSVGPDRSQTLIR
jgi:adenylosuccinate synthase